MTPEEHLFQRGSAANPEIRVMLACQRGTFDCGEVCATLKPDSLERLISEIMADNPGYEVSSRVDLRKHHTPDDVLPMTAYLGASLRKA